MHSLCLDFGNTRYKYAIFCDDIIQETGILHKEPSIFTDILSLIKKYGIERSILSSVVKHDNAIEELLSKYTNFHCVGAASILPFKTIPLPKNEGMPADRLALCAAATIYAPAEHHSLIISLGTCITYNFIDCQKRFLGGSISPGLLMRYKAINHYTHLVPLLEPCKTDFPLIGYDTATNLHSGVMLGIAAEINGIIELYEKRYDQLFICLTGGDVEYLVSLIKKEIFADYFFLFKGLYMIGKNNWNT